MTVELFQRLERVAGIQCATEHPAVRKVITEELRAHSVGPRCREESVGRREIQQLSSSAPVDLILAFTVPFDGRERAADEQLLKSMPLATAVGAFEGASYEARGLYRPQADCIMFTRDRVGFCAVCRRAIGRIVDLYAK